MKITKVNRESPTTKDDESPNNISAHSTVEAVDVEGNNTIFSTNNVNDNGNNDNTGNRKIM